MLASRVYEHTIYNSFSNDLHNTHSLLGGAVLSNYLQCTMNIMEHFYVTVLTFLLLEI